MEIETSADPAVLWLRARQLCHLCGHAPQSGEIIGVLKLKDDMPADLADTLNADDEDHKTDRAPLVAVTENEEVSTLTATIETNLRQGGAVVKEEVATESCSAEASLFVIAVKTRHTLWCCVSLVP